MPAVQAEHILSTLKRVTAVLRSADIPFALGGGLAAWARGGPPTEKDIDLLVREEDADAATGALRDAGFRIEIPPEGWLVKAFEDDLLIDLIHRPAGMVVDLEFLERCDEMSVHAVPMRVMPVDDLVASKLLSLTEHHLDFGPLLEVCRALREQIHWQSLYERTQHSPFARSFFALIRELRIADVDAPDSEVTP